MPAPQAERYLALSHEMYGLLSIDGVLLDASGAWRSVLGREPSDLRGLSFLKLVCESDVGELSAALDDLRRKSAATIELTTRCRNVDGSARVVAWRLATDGEEGSIIAAGKDVTQLSARTLALADSEARFRAAQDGSPDGFMLFKSVRDQHATIADFVCVYANPAAERLTKRSGTELQGTRLLQAFPGSAAEGLFDAYVGVVETGQPWQAERIYAFDGHDVGLRITAVKQDDGFSIAFSDITERLRAQAALQAERTRFAHLFKLSPAFICTLRGPEHVFEMANDAYYKLVGAREIIGRRVRDAIPEAVQQGFIALLDDVLATGEPFVANSMPIRLNRTPVSPAEWRYVSFVYLPLTEADGSRTGIFVHGVDVTDHARTVQALKETQLRFEHLSANVPGMVFQYALAPSGADRFLFASEGARHIFGCAPSEIQRAAQVVADRVHPADRTSYEKSIANSAATLEPWQWEGRVVGAGGEVRWVRGVSRPEKQADGTIVWDGVLLDVTDQRRAERQHQESERRFQSLFDHNPMPSTRSIARADSPAPIRHSRSCSDSRSTNSSDARLRR